MSDAVWDIAVALKEAVIDGYAAAGISLPARRYIADGLVAMDNCEQFAVQLVRDYEGLPGLEDQTALQPACLFTRAAEFDLWIIHCAPKMDKQGKAPSVADIEASAHTVLIDAALLPRVLYNAYVDGMLNSCDSLMLGQLLGYGPEGGVVGIHMRVDVQVSYTATVLPIGIAKTVLIGKAQEGDV